MKLLFVSGFLAYLLVTILFLNTSAWLPKSSWHIASVAIIVGALLAKLLLQALIAAPLAVAIHRFILLDSRTPGIISLPPSYTRLFFVWMLGFYVLAMLIGLFGGAIIIVWPGGKVLFWIGMLAFVVLSVLSILIFPDGAIEAPSSGWRERIGASWRRMEGRFWKFVWAAILMALPVIIPFFVVFGIFGAAGIYFLRDSNFLRPFSIALGVTKEMVDLLMITLGAALASWLYASASVPGADSEVTFRQ